MVRLRTFVINVCNDSSNNLPRPTNIEKNLEKNMHLMLDKWMQADAVAGAHQRSSLSYVLMGPCQSRSAHTQSKQQQTGSYE